LVTASIVIAIATIQATVNRESMIIAGKALQNLVDKGLIKNPIGPVVVESVSIDLHLDNQFIEYIENIAEPFVPPQDIKLRPHTGDFVLPPRGKVLACTRERVKMPVGHMGFVQTKGSLARGFLMAHLCDGQVDPGYEGKVTLELVNFSDYYYKLVPGLSIARLFVARLSEEVTPYAGRYQSSDTPTPMRAAKPPEQR
jgi:dCTP deaminase